MLIERHLRLVCGPWILLAPSTAVREVIELEHGPGEGEAAGRRLWRGHSVPVLDARAWLGAPPLAAGAPQIDVVIEEAGREAALRVDDVAGLIQSELGEVMPLPPLPAQAALRFDAALFDAERGLYLLRLRMSAALDAAGGIGGGGIGEMGR